MEVRNGFNFSKAFHGETLKPQAMNCRNNLVSCTSVQRGDAQLFPTQPGYCRRRGCKGDSRNQGICRILMIVWSVLRLKLKLNLGVWYWGLVGEL